MAVLFLLISLSISLAFAGSIQLSPDCKLDWSISGQLATFDLTANRKAWIGLGFHAVGSDNSMMTNADIIVASFNDAGVATVEDYFSEGYATPELDTDLGGQNNVLNPSASQGTVTRLRFSRALNTADQWDSVISSGPLKLIWALGTDNEFNFHGFGAANRGQVVVDLFAEDVCGPLQGCNNCVSKGCVYCSDDSLCYDKGNLGQCKVQNNTCEQVCDNALPNAWVPNGFCASVWAAGLSNPRGIETASNGDMLVVESGKAQITALWDSNADGISDLSERAVIAGAPQINHAIRIHEGYLYASSPTTLYRWKYTAGTRTNLGSPQIAVNNIPCCHHVTRSIAFDSQGRFYVSVGSASNVDKDSTHARINSFNVSDIPAAGGINWNAGRVFADGLRNEVGIRFDKAGRLWGVENGVDNLNRADLGGDIHTNNPSEELNLFEQPAKFYGYPYCWTEYSLPAGKGRGTQWAHPNFMGDGTHTDAWCQNTQNVVPPAYSMGAHLAPLDILFYDGKSFPAEYQGDAFVTLHGSWNRSPAVGYRVIRIKFDNGKPVGEDVLLRNNGANAPWPNSVRPVAMTLASCGQADCLYVTSDASGQLIRMSYQA